MELAHDRPDWVVAKIGVAVVDAPDVDEMEAT